MEVYRIAGTLTKCRGLINKTSPMLSLIPRYAHTQPLTENMLYISTDKQQLKLDPNTLKLDKHIEERPLCIMIMYLMAKPKHVLRYADLYLRHGFDVIAVSCTPLQLMWPARGSQVIADRLLAFLESNRSGNGNSLTVHGFSVGAYVWAELLVKTLKNRERYQPLLNQVTSQVWDSPANVEDIPYGVPPALFPNNKSLQSMCKAYLKAHLRILYDVSTKHYLTATKIYFRSPCVAPGLFLVSKTDAIGRDKTARRAAASWESLGIKCNFKCWERSPHVQHYLLHPDEYKTALYSHLQDCGVLKNTSYL